MGDGIRVSFEVSAAAQDALRDANYMCCLVMENLHISVSVVDLLCLQVRKVQYCCCKLFTTPVTQS